MLQKIIDPNGMLSQAELNSFANRHGICLPESYVDFLLKTNGGQPVPAVFPIEGLADNPYDAIQSFYGMRASLPSEDLERNLAQIAGIVPKGILPIACTGCGDELVLDLRQATGRVLFWDRKPFWGTNIWSERDLYWVAPNFKALLTELRDIEA
jgi:hypothetical protein